MTAARSAEIRRRIWDSGLGTQRRAPEDGTPPYWPAPRGPAGLHYPRLSAGVEPAPIGGPPGGQHWQGARTVLTIRVCAGWALHAPIPLPNSLCPPMAATAETCRGGRRPLPLASDSDMLGRLGRRRHGRSDSNITTWR